MPTSVRPAPLELGNRRVEQRPRRREDLCRARRRSRQRVRAGRPRVVAEAEPEHDGAPDAAGGPHAPRDPVDERDEVRVDRLVRPRRAAARALRADRPAPAAPLHGPWVEVVGERVEVPAARRPEHRDERRLGHERDPAHGRDAAVAELAGRDRPHAPEPLDRERVEERELAVGRDDEEPVGLGDARSRPWRGTSSAPRRP